MTEHQHAPDTKRPAPGTERDGSPEEPAPDRLEDGRADRASVAGPWIDLPVLDVFARLQEGGYASELAMTDALRDLVLEHEPAADPRWAEDAAASALEFVVVQRRDLHPSYAPDGTGELTDDPSAVREPPPLELPTGGVRRGGSWEPRDLGATVQGLVDGSLQRPRPSLLCGGETGCLFYRGRINALWAESESWKTWVALLAVRDELHEGRAVVYVDLEDDELGIVGRLLALGTRPDAIVRHLRYVQPEGRPSDDERAALLDLAARAALVVLDSVGELLALEDLDGNSDTDYAGWAHQWVKPLTGGGAAILLVDHLPHANAGILRPIGSQRKKASVDGAAYRVEVLERPGAGIPGRVRLTVAKDRHGTRRTGDVAADLVVVPGEGEQVIVTLEPPRAGVDPRTDDVLLAVANAGPEGLTKKDAAAVLVRGLVARGEDVKGMLDGDLGAEVRVASDVTATNVSRAAQARAGRELARLVKARLADVREGVGNRPHTWTLTPLGAEQIAADEDA